MSFSSASFLFELLFQHHFQQKGKDSRLCRLKRLHGAKKSLQAFDKASSARLDEVCAELKRNSDLLALIKADLDHIFHNIRYLSPHIVL